MEYRPGTVILNKYRIEAKIGHGAFGVVYRVTHLRLNMLRAIKVLRRDMSGVGSQMFEQARDRFDFEARLGVRLEHPNVIKVYDFEEIEGELLLVMEYASGGSLAERLESGQTLDVDQAIRLGMDICAGLSAIHEKLGAVHRDLKPSNILFGEDGNAKICDLGLAQVPDDNSRRSLLGSLAGIQPGTPIYMSPEQESTKGYLLPSSDIFSLGCVLFEALTGKPYKAVYGRRLRELRPEIPAWLDEIICRALAETPGRVPADDADPNKRYRTAELLRRDLQAGWEATLRARQAAKEKARREAEQRAEEMTRLEGEGEAALRRQDWAGVQERIARLVDLGSDGAARASCLREKLGQAKEDAEQRAAQIRKLKSKAETSIAMEEWGRVNQAIAQLEKLEGPGQDAAQELQARLEDARREAEQRSEELKRLEREAENALKRQDYGRFDVLIVQLETEGSMGAGIAVRLREKLGQAKGDAEQRAAEIRNLKSEVEAAIARQEWVRASRYIAQLWRGGIHGQDAARELQARLGEAQRAQERKQKQQALNRWLQAYRYWIVGGFVVMVIVGVALWVGLRGGGWITPEEVTAGLLVSITDDHGVPMVLVPAGEFQMGSEEEPENEKLVHTVYLDDYYIDKYEVTNSRYAECVGAGVCQEPSNNGSFSRHSYYNDPQYATYPVIYVDWEAARTYCKWRGGRLPTEVEWEKAARGTDGRVYPWGEGIDCSKANYWGRDGGGGCVGDTTEVGSYPGGASPYGVLDMAGNVGEWVADWYKGDFIGLKTGQVRVLRGGSWYNGGGILRSAYRGGYDPGYTNSYLGFRCARSP